jgi:HEAT repeat protein
MVIHWIEENRWDKCVDAGSAATEALIGALDAPAKRLDVIKTLGQIRDLRAVHPLVGLLKEDDLVLKEAIIKALKRIGPPAVQTLISLVENTDDPADLNVRLGAIEALGEIGSDQALEPLLAVLRQQNQPEDKHLRKFAAETLGQLGNESAADSLLVVAEDFEEAWEIREAAINGLGQLKSKKALEPLLALLEDWNQNGYLRRAAALALGEIGSYRAIDPLLKALKSKNNHRAAAEALGKIGNKSVVKPLIDLLGHYDEEVDSAAALTLEKLTGQNFGADKAGWEQWWIKKKS